MPGAEFTAGPSPESYLVDVFNSRPPIPADRPDISELVAAAASAEGTEPGYAWERLPLWIAEIKKTFNDIGDLPILGIDFGSSAPLYVEILRSLEFDRDGVRGRELVRGLFGEESIGRLGEEAPELKPVVHAIGRDQETRDLLEAAVQESLYEITLDETSGTSQTNPLYQQRLYDRLKSQATTYLEDREAATPEVGRGFRVTGVPHEQTYLERLAALAIPSAAAKEARWWLQQGSRDHKDQTAVRQTEIAGLALAERFIDWQSRQLAEAVVGNPRYRPARFLSTDLSEPRDIAISSIINTPRTTQSLDIFPRAVNSLFEPTSHFTANLFDEPPVPDNSVALITCFDAWPLYFQTDDREDIPPDEAREAIAGTLQTFYNKLAYGGKMVFFPWAVLAATDEERQLSNQLLIEAAAEFGARNGVRFGLEGIHRNTLDSWMSPSDRTTSADLSPIFKVEDDYFFALIVAKPAESSVKASKNWLARMAVEDGVNDSGA